MNQCTFIFELDFGTKKLGVYFMEISYSVTKYDTYTGTSQFCIIIYDE